METMTQYIGTKTLWAMPMNRLEYNNYRGWALPPDENGEDEGYLVEYTDGGESNHANHTGYISWSPKAVFEKAYQPSGKLTFGHALALAKKPGTRLARQGWNGKGMFIYYVPGGSYPAQTEAARYAFGEMVPYGPYLAMKTAQGNVVPWLASQTDILADDWMILQD